MRLSIVVLSLAFGLGFAGLACAEDEPAGNWLGRVFAGSAANSAPESASSGTKKNAFPPAPSATPAERLRKAKSVWLRRQEVCLALRELADQHDDEELRRKVDLLEQRAHDAYVAATRFSSLPNRARADLDTTATPLRQSSLKERSP
jgi:hypothetical protein